MKVICVNNVGWLDNGNPAAGPSYLEKVTIKATHNLPWGSFYEFKEYDFITSLGQQASYRSTYFRMCTDDEIQQENLVEEAREIVKERELVEV